MATVEFDVVHVETNRDEIRAELDQLARGSLGISADDFMARLGSGDLDAFDPTVARLAVLARLL